MLVRRSLGRQSFLHLPPQLRTTLYRQSIRPFHFHIPQIQLPDVSTHLDLACALPHAALTALHATGLPWVIVLPLSAFLIRGLILVPALSIPARRATQRWLDIHPLKSAWSNTIRRRVLRDSGDKGPSHVQREANFRAGAKKINLHWQYRAGVYRRLVPTFAQFPVFLCLAETVRRMCGANVGLLGLMFGRQKEAPTLEGWQDTTAGQEGAIVAAGQEGAVDAPVQLAPWLEPSMANEGALWFQDLTVADPTLTLPFLVSGIMFLNLWRASVQAKGSRRESLPAKTLRRTLLLLTLAIGPLTLNVPAGVMVYWLGSSLCAMTTGAWLDSRYPLKVPPKAAKGRR
ncbi:hypothetical protein W97_08094 [Coniosporium apollinis CBS 100218]|uniref:Preprotein translocase subunit YidC n=1 Tax=Coniosporium apollinis (strain CBS 100218) TaxID=1168221 RepID=R7Z4H5_CONA1|nr:uncharacterized protein W97_08094 [Coniosporium apollinis CBS 100218]EON68836.1 hypothetical protein W97_08094 [Coniosporium apollinis CBS 100218]